MRLTTKSRYGTRLILDLAMNAQAKPVSLSEISKRQAISLKYLEKLIRKLKKAGFVKSIRGPYGGYMLAKPMKDIAVGDIVRVLEGSEAITDCSENDNVCGVCTRAGKCVTQFIWMEASKAMFEKLDSFKIDALIQDPNQTIKNAASVQYPEALLSR
jgi:Rrf2 family protein